MALGDTKQRLSRNRTTMAGALSSFMGGSAGSGASGSSGASQQPSTSYLDFFKWNKKGTKSKGYDLRGILKHLQELTDVNQSRTETQLADSRRHLQQGYAAGLGSLDRMGQSETREINRAEAEGKAGAEVNTIDRGLFNSTVLDALKQRVGETAERQRQDVAERVATTKAGLEVQRGEALSGLEERVTNEPPNLALYLPLIQQITAADEAERQREHERQMRLAELDMLRNQHFVIGSGPVAGPGKLNQRGVF